MGFMDDLVELTKPIQQCKMAVWLDGLDPDYRTEVEEALASDFGTNTIWRVIVNREGNVFSASVVAKHRGKECCCGLQG